MKPKSKATRVFVIRFAKKHVKTTLYFSPYEGQVAFVDNLNAATGWYERKDAEAVLKAILEGCPDPEVRGKLEADLEIEEHEFGGKAFN